MQRFETLERKANMFLVLLARVNVVVVSLFGMEQISAVFIAPGLEKLKRKSCTLI